MSLDFCFWHTAFGDPASLYEQAAEGDYSEFVPSQPVVDFRTELVARWPELEDFLEPLAYDPVSEEAGDISRCVIIALPLGRSDLAPAVTALALSFGLRGYDPQQEGELSLE